MSAETIVRPAEAAVSQEQLPLIHTIKTTFPLEQIAGFNTAVIERTLRVSDSVVTTPDSLTELTFDHKSPGGGFYHALPERFQGAVAWNIADNGTSIGQMDISLEGDKSGRYDISFDTSVPLYEVNDELYEGEDLPDDLVSKAKAVGRVVITAPAKQSGYDLTQESESFGTRMAMARVVGILGRIDADKQGSFEPTYPPEVDYRPTPAKGEFKWG